MQAVVDANILFSMLIKNSAAAEIFANNSGNLFAPEFILGEFANHRAEILSKTKKASREFEEILAALSEILVIIPREEYADELAAAEKISPDPKDIAYIALALKLKIPVWSNDKKLKEQSIVAILSTKDIIDQKLM